ncbi:hypothetical protein, partial [Helicobacter pylori]|uniref:hypothetical protein n=1 Tax=Helicobacter pylori TaxID=210 RepID=UPI003CC6CDAB
NHPIIQSNIQSSNQRYPVIITFTKTHLKIPYFLIIPSFINPHHIFQPFDSISPIFQSVGLTELNLKER